MKVAALDLGTNTFLCLIVEVESGVIKKIIDDQVRIVRLGQGMNRQVGGKKTIHPEALIRAKSCLKEFAEIIQRHKPDKVLAMATSAAREATNAAELFKIGQEFQIPIEVIPGAREAEITYEGSISGQQNSAQAFLVIDIGGGSTEIILGHGAEVQFSKSLNIGCVRLTESFLPTQPASPENLTRLRQEIADQIKVLKQEVMSQFKCTDDYLALAVAGTPTELARIQIGEFKAEKIDGFQLTKEQLTTWETSFSKLTPEEIARNFGVSAGRADVILVGVMILQEFCRAFNIKGVEVSTRGVRFGVALEIEKREKGKK